MVSHSTGQHRHAREHVLQELEASRMVVMGRTAVVTVEVVDQKEVMTVAEVMEVVMMTVVRVVRMTVEIVTASMEATLLTAAST